MKKFLCLMLTLCLILGFLPQSSARAAASSVSSYPIVQYNGHSYQLFEDADSWEDAKRLCEQRCGHLATITSLGENKFLYDYITAQGITSAYFGLTDRETEGVWEWVTRESVSYTNWHPGEPNSENSNEDYAMFYWKYTDATWNDGDFGNRTNSGGKAYLCEWEGILGDDHYTIQRDNNFFTHSLFSFFADYSIENHRAAAAISEKNEERYLQQFKLEISDEMFALLLRHTTDPSVVNLLQTVRNSPWGGSCFGISATTALAYTGDINLSDYTGRNCSYYQLGYDVLPKNNTNFCDLINYFHLSQFLDYYKSLTNYNHNPSKSQLSEQLGEIQRLAEFAQITGRPFLLSIRYTHKNEKGKWVSAGHTLVGVGASGYSNDGSYRVRIADPNEQSSYLYLDLIPNSSKTKFVSFRFDRIYTAEEGVKFKNIIGNSLSIVLPLCTEKKEASTSSDASAAGDTETTHFYFNSSTPFSLTDMERGKTLFYDGDTFTGNLEPLSCRFFSNGENNSGVDMQIEIEKGRQYHLSTEASDSIRIYSGTDYYAFDINKACSVNLALDEGFEVSGTNFDYTVYASTEKSHNLVAVSGHSDNAVTVARADDIISVDSDTNTYQDIQVFVDEKILSFEDEDNAESIKIKETGEKEFDVKAELSNDPPTCSGGWNCPGYRFDDMPLTSNWAHKGLDFCIARGLLSGTSNTTISPNMTMNRAMLVTILYSLDGKPTVTARSPFTDVPNNSWYSKPVIWAAANGIVSGSGNGKFNPNGSVTREQIAVMLRSYAQYKGYSTSASVNLSRYPDAGSISTWAKDAFSWAVAAGLISGTSVGSATYLNPKNNATRAQVATILMQFVTKLVER